MTKLQNLFWFVIKLEKDDDMTKISFPALFLFHEKTKKTGNSNRVHTRKIITDSEFIMTAHFVVDFTLKEHSRDLFLPEATDPWSRTFDLSFDYFQNALKLHSNVDASLNRMNIKIQVYFQANYSLFMSSWFFSVSHKVLIFSIWSLICFQFVVWEKEKVVASKYGNVCY